MVLLLVLGVMHQLQIRAQAHCLLLHRWAPLPVRSPGCGRALCLPTV